MMPHDKKSIVIEIEDLDKLDWVKFNPSQKGFYMVHYGEDGKGAMMWDYFSQALQTDCSVFDPADRSNLLNDAFSLSGSGLMPYDTALDLTLYLNTETHFMPWKTIKIHFEFLLQKLANSEAGTLLQNYLEKQSEALYSSLGWKQEGTTLEKFIRTELIDISCGSLHTDCLTTAASLLSTWVDDVTSYIHPDVRALVFTHGMTSLTDAQLVWDKLWDLYTSGDKNKDNILNAITHTKETALIKRLLELSMNGEELNVEDFFPTLNLITTNYDALPIIWSFYRDNWELLVERFTIHNELLGELLVAITNTFATEQQLKEMTDFFEKYPDAGDQEESRQTALVNVRDNIRYRERNYNTILTWLQEHA